MPNNVTQYPAAPPIPLACVDSQVSAQLLKIVRKEQKEVAAKKSGKAANHKPAVQTSSTEDALDAAPAASQTDGLNKEGGLGASK